MSNQILIYNGAVRLIRPGVELPENKKWLENDICDDNKHPACHHDPHRCGLPGEDSRPQEVRPGKRNELHMEDETKLLTNQI